MGHQLKSFTLDNGNVLQEKACEDYVCRFCGAKANAVNYVANLCLQVFPKHLAGCEAYVEDDTYVGYVNECSTCRYYGEELVCTKNQ